MEKALKELILALKSIGDALMGKVNSSNNDNEEGGNTDSKNLFLGYNIPDKLVFHGLPNDVYFDSLQEAIQYFESNDGLPAQLDILYKDLTLDTRNCYISVFIEKAKSEYHFDFLLLNSSFDTEHPFTIDGENYYKINSNPNV